MNKLWAFLLKFVNQPDKFLHFVVCFMAEGLLLFSGVSLLASLWLCTLLAWGKEKYDKAHPDKHSADGWDAFATLAGGLTAATLYPLFF